MAEPARRPNILLVVSDQERERSWLPAEVPLPWRERLLAEGMELANFWTHSSPCSPSRATLMTGQYVPQHGVVDNLILPHHTPLDPALPTVGRLLHERAGYRSSYIGKWHLSYGPSPDMVGYGYADWEGNDQEFMGWAGTGAHFDPLIADNAAHWLRRNADSADAPWFLTVALVNPHDVMWFPIDQPDYQAAHDDQVTFVKQLLDAAKWKADDPLPAYGTAFPERFGALPANFDDDLHTKPDAHRAWRHDQQHGIWGYIDPRDTTSWLRQLDYYAHLHELADVSLGKVLSALDETGHWDDTVVIFTSDHGDMCGSHGLRSKGPFLYNEIMRVPFYIRVPGRTTAGSRTSALASSVDLAPTICGLAGLDPTAVPELAGVDLSPLFADADTAVRDHVMFAMDSAHTSRINQTRYAVRGCFDGRYKYARYYGIGGGKPNDDFRWRPSPKLFDVDADFDDQDHELYDLVEDPAELVNLAADRAQRVEVRERFAHLRALEGKEYATALRDG